METSKRVSGYKALTWRAIATLTTTSITYALTGKLELTIKVGIYDVVIKLILYFLHERIWEKLKLRFV